ncbi:hypothetical protein ACQ4M4_20875 [Leptolyngbya sp. AN02str]|uniref:hypothetical protein n=1 Tax=Leptolyngbya sp. AN02str TaxID=3423363 RepID=UPI003D31C91E
MPEQITIQCQISVLWQAQLEAIAQSTGRSIDELMQEAVGFYISRYLVTAPSMSASSGTTYEELESEPDEILWDFLPETAAPSPSPARGGWDMDDDEPDEILPGFAD